jgi:single stranded DNA-binding protein
VGFFGSDPEQRQVKGSGIKFTVMSVATQRSWKNSDDEWASKVEWHRIAIFRPRLSDFVAAKIEKGAHVLIEGSLVSSTYEAPNGKSKKSKAAKTTSWSIRADVVRRLDRGKPEPETLPAEQIPESNEAPF